MVGYKNLNKNYSQIAREVRRQVFEMIYRAQTSHIGSNLSCIDLLTVLYEKIRLDGTLSEDRDRVIFSKGWAAAAAYVFLARKGVLTQKDLDGYCKDGSPLIGLVERSVPGIEASTGSMGHGLPIGVGMALGAKRSNASWRTYVLLSDGEMGCGTTWESALLAAQHKLGNLVAIIDYNGWQAMDRTNNVLPIGKLHEKFKTFGWETRTIHGHYFPAIEKAFTYPRLRPHKPLAIIAHTVKGKGVSFMEDKLEWHYKNIDDESYKKGLAELS